MKWELLAKLLKRYYFLIMICAAAAGMMMYGRNASADGGINSNEARVISVATGGFSYNNELYTARQEYVDQLIAYLCRSDVNLTESQADKAISAIYANIETGVNEGYIVKQGARKMILTLKMRLRLQKYRLNREGRELMMYQKLIRLLLHPAR